MWPERNIKPDGTRVKKVKKNRKQRRLEAKRKRRK